MIGENGAEEDKDGANALNEEIYYGLFLGVIFFYNARKESH